MSRLNDLIRQVAASNPRLATDLQREISALADRRSFGLNFERHVPEAVELPGRPVRKGDKVRCLPERGQMPKKEDERLFRVLKTYVEDGNKWADVEALDDPDEGWSVLVDDLVVVAEFRDPIYPGLVSTGKVECGGDKPFHTVINAENYHALQTLLYTHRGKVDCIYIDPPYNTGAKDWKYNNDYVEGDDVYRHSKWLAFMERRLLLAKELLNPEDSVLIVTIDEKEYLRLGLLLEQTFPEGNLQMVTAVTNPRAGVARPDAFTRSDEYIYFVQFGSSQVVAAPLSGDPVPERNTAPIWFSLMRTGSNSSRRARPNLFYPIWVNADGTLHSVGEALPLDADRNGVLAPELDVTAVWPLRPDGTENTWQLGTTAVRRAFAEGTARLNSSSGRTTVNYLRNAEKRRIEAGDISVLGRDEAGALILRHADGAVRVTRPRTVWASAAHDAGLYGSPILKALVPSSTFPFPKSLYAVEDTLRFFLKEKPHSVVLDFFTGSGTTAHAVMRLNKQDDGRRQSISVTNNEVSADEQKSLREEGLRPGDPEWEEHGICDYITKPRVQAAITGMTTAGDSIKGDYKFTDEFPMADGFEENVEFFTLTYEAPLRVASNRDFERIAPLLWMRAGSFGRRIDDITNGWDVADAYGVIADLDQVDAFVEAMVGSSGAAMAVIVTNDDRLFESLVRVLPEHVEPVRLYESYLRNFEIESGRSVR